MASKFVVSSFRGRFWRGIFRCPGFAARSHNYYQVFYSSSVTRAASANADDEASRPPCDHIAALPASRVARARSSLAAAILGTVRAIVPTEFLKTPDNIHRHRKVLHHPLLNNVWLKDMLGGGAVVAAGADGTALPPDTLDRALIATGAVEQLQRTAAISGLARSFADRASLRSSGGSDGAVSRLRNPITAYCGAPGGGKSAVLELAGELATTQSWSVELCPDPAMRAALNAAIAVTVTYNSGMDANVNKYDKDPEFGLALRILYSALVQDAPGAYSFHEFWLSWTKHAVPSPVYIDLQLAIDACMLAFSELTPRRTGMLLLIDETRKLAGSFRVRSGVGINDETNGVYDMLGVVGSALDSNCSAVFNVAVTTLDSLMLRAVSTNSGRRIDWVGLDGLRQPAAEAMIMGALGHSASGVPVPALVSLSIADCARHPRTLETLSQVLLLRSVEQNGAPGWFRNFGELKRTRQAVTKRLGTSESSPLWAVRAALNGVPLPYTAEIDGSGGTSFSTAIAAGVFLNTLEADSTGSRVDVPRLSFMHLLRAVDELPVAVCDAIVGLASGEESCLDAHLSKSPFGGAGFEDFVLGWLKLRFGLAAATGSPQGLSLEELFVLKVDSNLPTAVRKTLCCRMMAGSTTRTDPTQFLIRTIPSDSFANAVNNARSRSKISEVVAAGCGAVTFIANNPAFDILLLVHEVATGSLVAGAAAPPLHAVAIEARFSSPTSKVRTTAENIKGKVKLFREQLGPGGAFAALGIPADRVTYVVMASRLDQRQQQQRTPPGSSRPPPSKRGLTGDEKTALLAQGVVVLDREGVARALTPTLVDRAYFLMQPQKPV